MTTCCVIRYSHMHGIHVYKLSKVLACRFIGLYNGTRWQLAVGSEIECVGIQLAAH